VIAKAEWTGGEANPRFIVTSLKPSEVTARHLYEEVYCARGDMENRIKECQGTVLHGSVSGRSEPTLACVQAMRTDFGRPSSSMQFRTMTATFISVA